MSLKSGGISGETKPFSFYGVGSATAKARKTKIRRLQGSARIFLRKTRKALAAREKLGSRDKINDDRS